MKRIAAILFIFIIMSGCTSTRNIGHALAVREKLQSGTGCIFDATITADFGEILYEFKMYCEVNDVGELHFIVKEPVTIEGISGVISEESGEFTFDDKALAFDTVAEGNLTPVTAPWVLIKTLRSGYIKSESEDGEYTRLSIDDSYESEALHLDIWVDGAVRPVRADILFKGRRCLTVDVSNFTFL